jgi:hypothetical protein
MRRLFRDLRQGGDRAAQMFAFAESCALPRLRKPSLLNLPHGLLYERSKLAAVSGRDKAQPEQDRKWPAFLVLVLETVKIAYYFFRDGALGVWRCRRACVQTDRR